MSLTASISLLTLIQAGAPASVGVVPAELALGIDQTVRITATVLDSERQEIEFTLRWFSADPTVATVDENGRVTGVGEGQTRVVAAAGEVPGIVRVVVTDDRPFAIDVQGPSTPVLQGTTVPLAVRVLTRSGEYLSDAPAEFAVASGNAVAVSATGVVTAQAEGTGTVRVSVGSLVAEVSIAVIPNTAASYEVTPASSLGRTGDVIRLELEARTAAGVGAGTTYPRWSVSGAGAQIESEGAVGVFVAERAGRYEVTAVLAGNIVRHATVEVSPRRFDSSLDLIGRGPIATHNSGDVWAFEGIDGRDYAYIGTFMHDWMKVWDITDPTAPVLTDSVQVDARRINDVKIHPNNRVGLITREGASNRRNGIVVLDLSHPAHPTILSEYTQTVPGGVHNVWISGEHDLIYAIHNGTSEMHIIDMSNPSHLREVGRWGLNKRLKSLHDVIVQDGYAYLSYWDDGLVILDVGAGTHGGTPTNPAFVSQFKYPIGNTHVAWRSGKYLFVGDELFPPGWNASGPIEARGYIHVLDVSNLDAPVEVARYEVPEAGAHNVWVEEDRLYIGYYQAGLRIVDISGELRGDLYRQGREIAAIATTDANTMVPNWPMAWSAQVFKDHIITSDMNSGLWITKLREVQLVP